MAVTPVRQSKVYFMDANTLERKWGDFYDNNPDIVDYLNSSRYPTKTRQAAFKLFEEIREQIPLQTSAEKASETFKQTVAFGLWPIAMGFSTVFDVAYGDNQTTSNMQRIFEKYALPRKQRVKKMMRQNTAKWQQKKAAMPTGY